MTGKDIYGKRNTGKAAGFEGPLDLLLHLIDKNKIDIYDIPIVEITNQYMEYIQAMDRADLNVMSEFLSWRRHFWTSNAKCFFQRKSMKRRGRRSASGTGRAAFAV